jgi:AbrB family looped-hinge helix DNA binding protein
MKRGSIATVSSKFQIVIPQEVRQRMKIKPGQEFALLDDGRSIKLVRVRPLSELRGFAKGMPAFEREPDREL